MSPLLRAKSGGHLPRISLRSCGLRRVIVSASQRGEKPMRFGVFYELQLPKPWGEGDEHRLFKDALAQMVLADRLGYDYAWQVEPHFLDEYFPSSPPQGFFWPAPQRSPAAFGWATASAR